MGRWKGTIVGIFIGLLAGSIAGQTASESAAPKRAVAIGEKAPAFKLPGSDGKKYALKALLPKEKGITALLFFRSADWWPFCQKQLVELQDNLKAIKAANVKLVGISYDSISVLQRFSRRKKVQYLLLSDSTSEVIRKYGILNKEVSDARFQGIPHPGMFLIDAEGRVRERLFYEGYKKRHGGKALIRAVRALRKEAKSKQGEAP